MSRKQSPVSVPEGLDKVLLHACCAPCSSAIVEWMLENGIRPVIFYYNPNIYPQKEYMIRKDESKRHADMVGVEWIDGDYDHGRWLDCVSGLECQPERGARCMRCFEMRLIASAREAQKLLDSWLRIALKGLSSGLKTGEKGDSMNAGTNFFVNMVFTTSNIVGVNLACVVCNVISRCKK